MANKDNKYKNLKINLDDISGIINAWGIENGYNCVKVEIPKDMNAQTLNYLVDCNGKVATVAVYPSKGGVFTISPNFGKEKEISKSITDYIASHTGNLADSNPYKNGLSIDIDKEEFGAFYTLLKEENDVVECECRNDNYKFFAKLRNEKYGDSIAISYFSTGKLLIQGKPLELFCLAVEILSGSHELQKVVNAEVKSAGLTVSGDDIISDMKKSLGAAYDFLGTAHKAMLSSAYVFYRTNIAIVGKGIQMDYSVLFHPASRVLEGYILKQLTFNNVNHDNGESLGYYFSKEDEECPLTLYPDYVNEISNKIISDEINRLYKLFHKIRHPYSHASENDFSTPIITKREDADKHFEEIITIICNSYSTIKDAKSGSETI